MPQAAMCEFYCHPVRLSVSSSVVLCQNC